MDTFLDDDGTECCDDCELPVEDCLCQCPGCGDLRTECPGCDY